ncbi:unnamed protein product, partial [Discosporangium mesarthrocarpum]
GALWLKEVEGRGEGDRRGRSEAIKTFLMSVLRNRLGDPYALAAVRSVARSLYDRPARQGKTRGEWKTHFVKDEAGHDSLEGWTAADMLSRVAGHSRFLSVLSGAGVASATPSASTDTSSAEESTTVGANPSSGLLLHAQKELLRLLLLLVSAVHGERESSAETQGVLTEVGRALVQPLLAVYGASMSEVDQVVVRLLRLLQEGDVPVDPNAAKWGEAAVAAAASQVSGTLCFGGRHSFGAGGGAGLHQQWKWFTAAVDQRRMRWAIEGFPIDRPLEPPQMPWEVSYG